MADEKLIGEIRLDTSKLSSDVEDANKKIGKVKEKVPVNIDISGIDNVVKEVDKINKKGELLRKTITSIEDGLKRVESRGRNGAKTIVEELQNTSTKFEREFNKIINSYKSLSLAERESSVNIKNTINDINNLSKGYELESKEVKLLLNEKLKLESLEKRLNTTPKEKPVKSLTAADYTNNEYIDYLQQYKTQQLTHEEFINKTTKFSDGKLFDMLDNKNQVSLIKELNDADSKRTKIIEEENKVLKINKERLDELPLKEAVNSYKSLNTEDQKRASNIQKVITEYNKLIPKYEQEGKEVSKLISQRNVYQKQLEQNIKTAEKEYQQLLRQYDVKNKGAFESSGVMGSGDARATIADKFKNSLIYTGSAATIGASTMAIGEAVKINKDYELGLNDLSRTLGNVTKKDLAEYGKQAIEFSKEFGQPLNEVQTAMTELARAGIDNKDDLESMTRTVLLGLNTTEIKDASQMTGYLVSTVKQLGLSFSDSGQIIDKWNYLADKYAVKTNDFAEATSKAGSASKMLKVDLDTLNAMVVVLGEATQTSGSEIGNAIKSLESRITLPKTVEGLRDLGIEVMKDEKHLNSFQEIMRQANVQLEKYGEGSKEANDILQLMGGSWRKNQIAILANDWERVNGLVEEAQTKAKGWGEKENAKVMETFAKQVEQLKNAFAELAIKIGESGLFDHLKGMTALLTGLADIINSIPAPVLNFLVLLGELSIGMKLLQFATKGVIGVDLGNVLLGWALKIGYVKNNLFGAALETKGYAAAQDILNTRLNAGLIEQKTYDMMLNSIKTNTKANNLTQQEAIWYQEAYNASLNSMSTATSKARIAMIAMNVGLGLAITAVTMGITEMYMAKEKANQQAKEAIDNATNEKKAVESLKEKYDEIKSSGELTQQNKDNLIKIQNELINTYGIEASKIDLVNKKYSEQIGIFDKLAAEKSKKANEAMTDQYNEAERILKEKNSSKIAYSVDYLSDVNRKQILSQFKNVGFSGDYEIKVSGTLKERVDTLRQLLNYTQELYKSNKNFRSSVSTINEEYNRLNGILKENQSIYDTYTKNKVIEDFQKDYGSKIVEVRTMINELNSTKDIGDKNVIADKLAKIRTEIENTLSKKGKLSQFKSEIDELFKGSTEKKEEQKFVVDQKAVNAVMKETREGMKLFNNALHDVKTGHKLTGEQAEKLIDIYPELGDKIQETTDGWVIEENALLRVRGSYIDSRNTILSAQYNITENTISQISARIGGYQQELEAIQNLAQAQMTIAMMQANALASINPGNDPFGLGTYYAISKLSMIESQRQKIEDLGRYRENLSKLKTISSPNYGLSQRDLEGPKPKKESYSSAEEVSEPADLVEKDRYYKLNQELNKTNILLERNQALQAGSKAREKLDFLRQEINLLKQKQYNLHNIAEENRREREEIVNRLKSKGVGFTGSGDSTMMNNFESVLSSKVDSLNAHRSDKDRSKAGSVYESLEKDYNNTKKDIDRFFEIADSIQKQSSEWFSSAENQNKLKIDIVNLSFDEASKKTKEYEQNLKQLDYTYRSISDNDFLNKTSNIVQKMKETKKIIDENNKSVNDLSNSLDDVSKNTDEYKDKMQQLKDTITEDIIKQKEFAKNLNEISESAYKYEISELKNKNEKDLKNKEDKLKKDISLLDKRMFNITKQQYEEYKNKVIEQLKEQSSSQEAINILQEEQYETLSSFKDIYNDINQSSIDKLEIQKKQLEESTKYLSEEEKALEFNDLSYKLQSNKITKFASEIESLKSINNLEQERIDRLKKQVDLEIQRQTVKNVLEQKNTKVFRAGVGFILEANQKKIREETEKLNQMQVEYSRWEKDLVVNKSKEKIDSQITEEQKVLSAKKDIYDRANNLLQKSFNDEKSKWDLFLTTLDNSTSKELKNLNSTFGKGFDEIITTIRSKIDLLIQEQSKVAGLSGIQGMTVTDGKTTNTIGSTAVVIDGKGNKTTIDTTKPYVVNNGNNLIQSTIDTMKANSSAWHTSDTTTKTQLANANLQLGASIGASRNSSGVWTDSKGNKLFDSGGLAYGKGIMLKDIIEPERTLSPQMTPIFDKFVTMLPSVTSIFGSISGVLNNLKTPVLSGIGSNDNSINIEHMEVKANNPNEFFSQLRNLTNLTKKK